MAENSEMGAVCDLGSAACETVPVGSLARAAGQVGGDELSVTRTFPSEESTWIVAPLPPLHF